MKYALAFVFAIVVVKGAAGDVSATQHDQAARERMPPIIGATESMVQERLKRRGFTGKVTVHTTSPALKCPPGSDQALWPGLVCASTPGGADEIPLDSEITLLIQGEHTVDEPAGLPPRVIGMSRDEAVTVLAEERFANVVYQFVDNATCAARKVCGLLLSGSSESLHKPDGTLVASYHVPSRVDPLTLQIGTAHPRGANKLNAEMINIVGDTLDVALAKLDAFGVRGPIRMSRRPCPQDTADIENGRICAQRPLAGQGTHGLAVEYAIAGQRQ